MNRLNLRLAVLLALACVPSAWAQAERVADPAEWAPPDAVAYIGITDIEATWQDYKTTSAYRVLQDEALMETMLGGPLGPLVGRVRTRLAAALDVPEADLKSPFKGPVALYLLAPQGGAGTLDGALIAGVGDATLMTKYYDTAIAKLTQAAARHETVSVGDNQVHVFERGEPKEGSSDEPDFTRSLAGDPLGAIDQVLDRVLSPDAMPPKLATCLTPDRLIVTGDADQVRAILRAASGRRTLADTDDHKALLRHFKPTGTVRVLVNIPKLVEMARSGAAGDEEALGKLRNLLVTLGGDSLRSMVGHLRLGKSSYESKADLLFLMSGERTGLAKILSMPNTATAPPARIPADACFYLMCNLNVGRLLDDIERVLRQTDPAQADAFRQDLVVDLPTGEKFDTRAEFLDHLTGPLTCTIGMTKPVAADGARLLLGMGQRNQGAMLRVLGNSAMTQMFQPRDHQGTQVFDAIMAPGVSVAATTDQVFAGSTASVENAVASGTGTPLRETVNWKRIERYVPEESWLTFYLDARAIAETAATLLEKGEKPAGIDIGSMLTMGLCALVVGDLDNVDASSVKRMLRYVAPQVVTVSTTDEGVKISFVVLRPEP